MITSEMLVYTTHLVLPVLLLTVLSSAVKLGYVTGRFGNQRIPIDFVFGDSTMEVKTHKPVNAPVTFRETTNLHIFSIGLVAVRNTWNNECYIQPFNATLEGMEKKVENAINNNGDLGEIKEERVTVGESKPLTPLYVKLLLGAEIAKFCNMHSVYLLDDENSHLLQPRVTRHISKRRAPSVIDDGSTDCKQPCSDHVKVC